MSEANDAAKAALNEIKAGEQPGASDEGKYIPVSDGTDNYTDIETQAAEMGWSPEGVEGKRNLSAEEFVDRQVLYDDIRSLKKSNKKLQEGLEASLKSVEGVRKREREKTIAELNAQKREALEENDFDSVMKIDEDLATVRAEPVEPQNNSAFDGWVEDNPWYHSNTEMRQFADMMGAGYHEQHKEASLSQVYEHVELETRKRFPDHFDNGNANRRRQSAVEGAGQGRQGSEGGGKPTRYTERDLPEQDRVIMDTILRAHPKMTKQDYLKQYFG